MSYPDNPFIGQQITINGTTKQCVGLLTDGRGVWKNITNGDREGRIQALEALTDHVMYKGALTGNAHDNSSVFSTITDELSVSDGEYYIKTNTTITADLYIKSSGKVVADNCTVTILGNIIASESAHILQEIGTGQFVLAEGSRLNAICAGWFGLTLSDPTPAVAEDNARAYRNAARFAGSLGIPAGVYDSKVLRMHTGVCYVDDYDSDGHYIIIPAYVKPDGYGDATVLKPIPNAKAGSIFSVVDTSASSVVFDNFQIDGDQAQQTNVINGISFEASGGAVIYSGINHGVLIKEMSGNAVRSINSGLENGWIKPKLLRDSKGHNVYLSAFINSEFESKVRSAKSGSWGLVAETANVRDSSFKGEFDENNAGNMLLSNVGARNTGDIKVSTSQQGDGVFFDRVDDCDFKVYAEQNAHRGVVTDRCDNSTFSVVARSNGRSGIENYDLKKSVYTRVNSYNNGTSVNNTYSNFMLSGDSDDNLIDSTTCSAGAGANRVAYNIRIDSQCNNNSFGDIVTDGNAVTSEILDSGIDNSIPLSADVAYVQQVLAGGASTTLDFALVGAKLGDFVEVVFSTSLAGIMYTAWVVSNDTVRVQLFNPTASQLTLTAGTATVQSRRNKHF